VSTPAGLEEAYISYEVTTVTSLPHFSSSRCSVRRRFRDFVSLSNLLPKLLHGRCEEWTAVHVAADRYASRPAMHVFCEVLLVGTADAFAPSCKRSYLAS
jgi:hypothetical protein